MLKINLISAVFIVSIVQSAFADDETCEILDRVVVTGASISSGFGVTTPPVKSDLGAHTINMKHVFEGIITSEHKEVKFFGDLLFFRKSRANAQKFIEKIKEYEPTLVIGLDFLFWFGHGKPPKDISAPVYRMEQLNFALRLLEQIDAPIIIGNLPDVRVTIGKVLSASQVPTSATLVKLNDRIQTWGDEHENVTVIDAFAFGLKLINDEAITIRNQSWPAGSQEKLLQDDMLHTTLEGTVAASLLAVESINADCLETNSKIIMKKAAANARLSATKKPESQ